MIKLDRNLTIAIIITLASLAFLAYSIFVHFQNTSKVDNSPFSKAAIPLILEPQ